MKSRLFIALLTVAGFLAASAAAPVAAQTDPDETELLEDAALFLVIEEIWLVERLGLVSRDALGPARIVPDLEVLDPADVPTPADLAEVLDFVEEDGTLLRSDAADAGVVFPGSVDSLLHTQGSAPRSAAMLIDALGELLAIHDLTADDLIQIYGMSSEGPPPTQPPTTNPPPPTAAQPRPGILGAGPGPGRPGPTVAGPTTVPAPDELAAGVAASGANGAQSLAAVILVLGGALVLVGIGVGFNLRRRSQRRELDDLVVQAGRQLAAALDGDRVAALAADAIVTTTGARRARLAAAGEQVEPVRSAVETGAPSKRTVDGEEVLAVPCVGDGRVLGVLVAVSPSRSDAAQILAGLASFVGPALASADRHGSAVDVDALTETFNRRRLDRDLASLTTKGRLVSLVMVDIDHFKRFNDDHGHAAGDAVLREVAAALRASVRPEDVVYRYGGEEFSIVLADTDQDDAAAVCERVRAAVERSRVVHDGVVLPSVTISAGVASTEAGDMAALSAAADGALYEAKRAGRNRVLLAAT